MAQRNEKILDGLNMKRVWCNLRQVIKEERALIGHRCHGRIEETVVEELRNERWTQRGKRVRVTGESKTGRK